MSQIIVFTGSGGGGGGSVDTLTGNNALPVSPLAGNINVVGDAEITTVTGNPGAHTLTVSLINTQQTTGQTIGFVTDDIASVTINANNAVSMICEVLGTASDFSAVCSGVIQCGASNDGVTTELAGVPSFWISSNDFGTATFDILLVGNDLTLRVTGEALTTINWKANVRFIGLP